MRTLPPITLAANEVKTFDIRGMYFEILACSFPLAEIQWTAEDGQQVDPWVGVKEGIYGNFPFKAFAIKNGATPQTISVFVGNGTGGNRAAPLTGSVAITNAPTVKVSELPGYQHTVQAKSFACSMVVGAVAANYGQIYLLMPTDKAKTAFVKSITITAAADMDVGIARSATALAWSGAACATSKLDASTQSAANLVSSTSPGVTIAAFPTSLMYVRVKAGTSLVVPIDEPIAIQTGKGMLFGTSTVNVPMSVSVEWWEE